MLPLYCGAYVRPSTRCIHATLCLLFMFSSVCGQKDGLHNALQAVTPSAGTPLEAPSDGENMPRSGIGYTKKRHSITSCTLRRRDIDPYWVLCLAEALTVNIMSHRLLDRCALAVASSHRIRSSTRKIFCSTPDDRSNAA